MTTDAIMFGNEMAKEARIEFRYFTRTFCDFNDHASTLFLV